MNKPLLGCLVICAGAGAYIYQQHQSITELRRNLAIQQALAQERISDYARAKAEVENLKVSNEVFKEEAAEVRRQLETQSSAPIAETPDKRQAEAPKGTGFMKDLAKMFTDPEMKKSMRAQQLVGVRMMYADLAKQLGLSPQDTEQLMEVLADRQTDLTAAGMTAMEGGEKDSRTSKLTDATRKYDEQLKAMLGEDRYKQMQGYEQTMGDRWMMQQWDGQFAATGSPLQPAQKDQLLALMTEERKNNPPGVPNLGGNQNPAQSLQAFQTDEGISRFMATQQEYNQRVLARSRDFLNADQVATLEKAQKQQTELLGMQMKMSRTLLGGSTK